jgi:hypothetical protein
MHHAYVIVGSHDLALAYLWETFRVQQPVRHLPLFGIEESRLLKAEQGRRLGPEERLHLVIRTDNITVEAQNALLKTLEEPTPGVHIFLLVSEKQNLLPTLLSRVIVVELEAALNVGQYPAVKKFLSASVEERLSLIAKFIEANEETGQLRPLAQAFGAELLATVRSAKLNEAVGYLYDRAALPRLVLEHIAMIV